MLKRLVLGLWFGSCAAWSVPVIVDQTTTDFQFVFTNATGVPGSGGTGVGAFVMGPDTPPAGSGSVNFQLPDGDHSVGLQTSLFSGTLLRYVVTVKEAGTALTPREIVHREKANLQGTLGTP